MTRMSCIYHLQSPVISLETFRNTTGYTGQPRIWP